MKGYITKGIGGFYYVKTPEGIVECKPRGIFRKQKITPVAGDEVTLETENGAAVIAEIAPRKNVFVRPPVANLDVLFLVASTTQPTPSTLVLDKLAAIAVDKGVQPVLMTLPPIDAQRYLDFLCRNGRSKERIMDWLGDTQHIYRHQELYSDTVARLAYETGTPLIGVREIFLGEKRLPGLISADGIHLTMDGYTKLFDTLAGWLRGAVI